MLYATNTGTVPLPAASDAICRACCMTSLLSPCVSQTACGVSIIFETLAASACLPCERSSATWWMAPMFVVFIFGVKNFTSVESACDAVPTSSPDVPEQAVVSKERVQNATKPVSFIDIPFQAASGAPEAKLKRACTCYLWQNASPKSVSHLND